MSTPRYARKQCKILLVGSPGCGKRTLAKALIRHDTLYLKIKTSEELPRTEHEQLANLDYIIFMVDFTSPHSLAVLKESLQSISTDYVLDRACIVVTKHDLVTKWAIDEKTFKREMGHVGKAPIFWADLSNEAECILTSKQLVKCIEIATGYQPNMNPWIISSCILTHPTSTSIDNVQSNGQK